MRPHGLQPTRLPHPWDSPGKNTGAGCHFLLQCMKVESESEVAQSGLTLSDPMDCSLPGSSIHGIFWATVLEWGAIAFSFTCWCHLIFIITLGGSYSYFSHFPDGGYWGTNKCPKVTGPGNGWVVFKSSLSGFPAHGVTMYHGGRDFGVTLWKAAWENWCQRQIILGFPWWLSW